MTTAIQPLSPLELPFAPPVTTVAASPLRRPKAPALALLGLGVILVFGPILGGMFAKTAAGNQMISQFAPYMRSSALARYGRDVQIIHAGSIGVDAIYRDQNIPKGQFPGLDEFRRDSTAIVGRATQLLDRVKAAQGDYEQVSRIGGFDRIPFLIVTCGLVEVYGACVLLAGRRSRAKSAAVLVVLASFAVGVYPFVSNLSDGSQAGQRMLHSLSPVMTPHKVRQLQEDFIVLVNVDGELSTNFRGVPQPGPSDASITTLVKHWPTISSDLASLVGVVNNNISNFNALEDLDSLARDGGLSGLGAFPWLLVGIGAIGAGLAVGAFPRRGKGVIMKRTRRFLAGMAATVFAMLLSGMVGLTSPAGATNSANSQGRVLTGLFRLTAGSYTAGHLGGTWFQMLQPGATVQKGPFMQNSNSPADGGLATLLQPGTAGGFRTEGYQSEPTPAFDAGGDARADSITVPTEFFNVKFSISTNKIDPQTKTACAPPVVVLKNGKLTADMSSWAASWNNQNFNQGAPKPIPNTGAKSPGEKQAQQAWSFVSQRWLGASPKATVTGAGATGTFNAKTGKFVLQWTSLIVGGPFNGFTGLWHLEGVYQPSAKAH